MIFIRVYIHQPPRSLFALVSPRRAAAATFFPVSWEGAVAVAAVVAVIVFTI